MGWRRTEVPHGDVEAGGRRADPGDGQLGPRRDRPAVGSRDYRGKGARPDREEGNADSDREEVVGFLPRLGCRS